MARMTPDEWRKKKEEEKKQGTTSSVATPSATSDTKTSGVSSGRMTPSEWKEKKVSTDVEWWMKSSRSLIEDLQKNSGKWFDEDEYKSKSSSITNLLAKADGWRKQYANSKEAVSYIDSMVSALSSAQKYLYGNRKYFSNWATEEDYNFWDEHSTVEKRQAWYADQQAKIDDLGSVLDNYYTIDLWYQSYQERPWEYQDKKEVEEKLAQYRKHTEYKQKYGSADAIKSEIAAAKAEMRNYERGNFNERGQFYGSKEADDYYKVTQNTDFGVDSANRDYTNATKEQLWDYDMSVSAGSEALSNGGYFDEDGNIRDSKGNIVQRASSPVIEDKLGMFLSAGKDEVTEAYNLLSAGNGNYTNTWANLMQEGDHGSWGYLDKNEIAIYYYLLNNNGQKTAYKYLSDMKTELNRRQTLQETEQWYTSYDEANLLEKIAMNAATIPAKFVSNVAGFVEDAGNTIMGNEINPYSAAHSGMHYSGAIRGATAEDLDATGFKIPVIDFTLGDIYQTGMSRLDSALATSVFGGGGTVFLGMGAAEEEAYRLYKQGASPEQITLGAFSAGAAEAVWEYISFGKLKELRNVKNPGEWVKGVLVQGWNEALEEAGTEATNIITNALIMGSQSGLAELYEENEESAFRTFVDLLKQTTHAAFGGFIGGIGAGATQATSSYGDTISQYAQAGNKIRSADGGAKALEKLAMDLAGATDGKLSNSLKKQAGKVSGEVATGSGIGKIGAAVKNYSRDVRAGKLYSDIQTANAFANHADIVKALTAGENGFSEKEAKKIAGALVALSNGLEITEEQSVLLESVESNPAVQGIVESINSDQSAIAQRNQQLRQFRQDVTVSAISKAITKQVTEKEFTPEGTYKTASEGKAIRTDTNEEIDIKGVKKISRGKLVLELADGSEIDAKSVSFANEADALIYEAVAKLGDNIDAPSATKLIGQFKGGNAMVFARGIAQAYTYGFYGVDKSELFSKHSLADKLTDAQRDFAYDLGKKYRPVKDANDKTEAAKKLAKFGKTPAEKGVYYRDKDGNATDIETYLKTSGIKLNDLQKTGIEAMRKMSKMMGIRFNVFETWTENGKSYYLDENGEVVEGNPNGFYDTVTGEIYIDLHAGNDYQGTMLFTVAHEVTHFMRQWSPEHFTKIAQIVFQHGGMKGNVSELVALKQARAKAKGKHLSYDVAMEEVVADGMETILKDGKVVEFMADVKKKDHVAWEKLKGWFKNLAKFLRKMIWAYKSQSAQTTEGAKVAEFSQDLLNQIERIYAEGAVASGENYQEAIDSYRAAQEQFSTANMQGAADGAVVQSDAASAIVEAKQQPRTEYEAFPKQIMSLSDGSGTLLHSIEGLKATKLAGLSGRTVNGYTGRDVRAYAMRISGFTEAQIQEVNKFMDSMADFMEKAGVTYKFIGLQDVKDAKLHYTYNSDGSIKSIVLSAMVKNGDYPVNFDLSSICKKREAMSKLIDNLAKRGSLDNGTVKLTPGNIFRINTALKDAGYETACLGCFVESKRYNSLEWAKKFCDKWNAAVKKANPNATYFGYGNATFNEDSFTLEQAIKIENAANKYITTTKTERLANAMKKYQAKAEAGLPLVESFSKAARDRLIKSDTISEELKTKYLESDVTTWNMADVEFLLENGILPGASLSNKQAVTEMVKSGEAYQHLLRPSDLLTDRGISKLEALPNFHGVLYGHYGSGTPKLMQSYTPYNSEIALLPANKNKDQSLEEYLYSIAGVRMQSFSDFQIQNIYDYLQMVADLAARKLPAHAYTKEISFAKLLGMTGIKTNLSVMFDIDPMVDKAHAGLTKLNKLVHRGEYARVVLEDEQGKWVYNIGDYQTQRMFAEAFPDEAKRFLQSIGFADAVKLQTTPGYSANCGIIGVGYSDLGIFAMLDDNRIRYIIPYHASSLPADIKLATNIALGTDYTPYQNNMKIKEIVDRNGNKVDWSIKEAYKRLKSGQAVINELNEKIRSEGWVVSTTKAQNGHGSYGLYEDLQQTNDPRQTASNFMDWCIGNGTLPLFYQFASHENYYKLLYDFNVYDCVTEEYAPQQAVTNTYPTMVDGQVQPSNVTDGGFNTEYLKETADKQMAFMNAYNENRDADLEKLAENMEDGNYSLHSDRSSDTQSDHVRFDQRRFNKTVDDIVYSDDNKPFDFRNVYMGETPQALLDLGFAQLPMTITSKHIYTIANKEGRFTAKDDHYHELGAQGIKDIPEEIQKPVVTFVEKDNPQRVVIVTSKVDPIGNPVMVAVEYSGQTNYNEVRIFANPVTTALGKKENWFLTQITEAINDGRLLQADKKRSQESPSGLWSQCPEGLWSSDFTASIDRFKRDVKRFLPKDKQIRKSWNAVRASEETSKMSDRDSMTPEQQKHFDYNQKQSAVGSTLKTLKGSAIKRSTKYGVGKEIGGEIYFHKDYAEDILPDEVLSQALQLLEEEQPGFEYNCLKYNPKTGVVAFQESPDFDTAREPVVGDYVSVNTNTGVVKTGHSNYIWHHKWNWVKNDYSGFDVEESWNWSKKWLSTLTEVSDGNGIERWNAQLDKFGLPKDGETQTSGTRYQLREVEPVVPTSYNWQPAHNESWFAENGFPLYRNVSDEQRTANEQYEMDKRSGGHGTQNKSTLPTYDKIFKFIMSRGDSPRILDASAGLGAGTELGKEYGLDIHDIEPYPNKEYKPEWTDYDGLQKMVESGEEQPFDLIISNAVLNVLAQDSRDNLVAAMDSLLKPGGQMFINVIGKDYAGAKNASPEIQRNKKGVPVGTVLTQEGINDAGREVFVWQSNSVQKVFSPTELKSYLMDALGDGYTVETPAKAWKGSGLSGTMVVITKPGDTGTAKFSDRDTDSTKFALRESVEETKDLLAFHNITAPLLVDALDRDGLLMPSLAITNKGMTDFGEISLLFDKSTIDPSANSENKLYGADAWTPTQTRLKKNAKFDTDKTVKAVNTVKNRIGSKYVEALFNITPKQFKEAIIKADGSIYDAYAHNIGMQTAYAMEKGIISKIPTTKSGTVDKVALQEMLGNELDTDNGWRKYKKWLSNISDTIITSYDAATNEDILNNMKAQPATAKTFKLSETGELVVPAAEYSSIDDVRKNKNRLSENAAEATKAVADEFLAFAKKIGGNTRSVVDAINATFANRYSTADIVKSFNSKGIKISTEAASKLQSLYKQAVELPTQYFEAKPGREVSLEEIKAVVMPAGTKYAELKSNLEERGISVVEYDGSNEARVEALNSMESLKFSDRDYVAYDRTAILKEETVDRWLRAYATKSSPNYAQAYIAYMKPDQFLELTTSDYVARSYIESESYELDEEKFAKATSDQPLFLDIDHETGKVYGHEGRHRCVALQNADIEYVPVLLFDTSNKYSKEDIPSILLKGQFNKYHSEFVFDAIPLSYENRDRVIQDFATQSSSQRFWEKTGTKNTLRFQDRDSDSVSNRTLLANAFEGLAQNDIERNKIQEYKSKISLIEAEEKKLREINEQIKELSFAKGPRDTKKIKALRFDAVQAANRINTYDKQLLRLEASKPLQDVLNREKRRAYKKAEERGKEALADYKAKVEAKQRETTEKWRESRKTAVAKARENAEKREAREKLQKLVLDTVKWISYPAKTDVKCPDILKKPYEAFLQGIDLSSKRLANGGEATKNDLRLANAMDSLATAIDRVMLSQDPSQDVDKVLDIGYLDLPADFVQKLRDMTENIKGMMVEGEYVVNTMTAAEVRQLSQTIRTLNHAIKTMSKLYANLRFANVEALGIDTMDFLDAVGEIEKTGGMKDFVEWDNALPYYAFKRFGKGGESVFEGLMDAQDKLAFLAKEIFAFQEKTWTGKEAKAWSEDTHTIVLPNGNELTLTTADAMSIYCLSRREHALPHLLGGGVRVMGIQKGSQKAKDSRSLLTIEDVSAIISSLTDRQKQVAEGIQEFMSTVCSDWGNEISMKRFLTKEFNEKLYFPIESNDENLTVKDPAAQQSDLFRLLNISATKPLTQGANNEVIIRNIFDVFVGHASDMARLNAYGMGLLDYMKWLNYREKTSNEEGQINVRGVRKSMEKAYGKAANSYAINLIKDVNGRASDGGDPTILMKWMRAAKTASVGASLRVATLQVTSYPRAALVLSPKSLALGLAKVPNIKRAKEYCGIALWKSFGFYDTNISRSIEDQMKGVTDVKQKLIELSLKGAEWGDAITWGALWNACEYEVAKTTTNKVGSEEFYQEVGKKLREVVYRTQVVDSNLTRSQIMRSKRGMAQETAAFMSEPTLSANILMDAGFEFCLEKRRTGSAKSAWKKTGSYIGRAVAVYAIGQLTAALMEGLWDAWRDDEDEEFGKKFIDAFAENLALDLVPFNKIPIVSDVFEAVSSMFGLGFYSSDKMSTTWITQAVSAVDAWKDVFSGESSSTVYNALYKSTRAVSSMLGISISGAMREGVALWNNTAGAYDSTLKIRTWDLSNADLGSELYEAIMSGNTRQADSLKAEFEDSDAMHSAVRKALRENDPRIKEAALAQYNGNPSERVRIAKLIIADGFAQDDVVMAINAEVSALKPDEGGSDPKKKGFYTTADFASEIANGDQASASAAKADIIATAQKNGKTAEQAEESFASSAKTELKKLFKAGDISEQKLIDTLVTFCGMDEDAAEKYAGGVAFEVAHPELDGVITYTQYQRWETDGKPKGVSLQMFTNVASFRDDGTSNSVKSQDEVALYISAVTSDRTLRHALWCCFYKASTSPWR